MAIQTIAINVGFHTDESLAPDDEAGMPGFFILGGNSGPGPHGPH